MRLCKTMIVRILVWSSSGEFRTLRTHLIILVLDFERFVYANVRTYIVFVCSRTSSNLKNALKLYFQILRHG